MTRTSLNLELKKRAEYVQRIRYKLQKAMKTQLTLKYKRLYWLSLAFEVEKENLKLEFMKKKKDPKLMKSNKIKAEAIDAIT